MPLEAYPESGVQVEEFSICIRTSETISRRDILGAVCVEPFTIP